MLLKNCKYRTKFDGSCVIDFLDRAFDPEGYESQLWAIEAQFMDNNGLVCDWESCSPNHNTINLATIAAIGLGI